MKSVDSTNYPSYFLMNLNNSTKLTEKELVLNALIHRDYSSPVDVQIKIFDHSISIFNPGKLYGDLTIEDLKTDSYQSHTRNKLIAEAFYLTKDIEKYGSGYIRVRKEIKEYPTMSFDYKEMGNGFLVNLKYKEQKISTTVTKDVTKDVTKEERESFLIEHMQKKPSITTEELAQILIITRRTVIRDIDSLKKQNKIRRIGGRKDGYWEIIKSK